MPTTIKPLSIRTILVVTALSLIASGGTFAWDKGAQGPAPRSAAVRIMKSG